MKKSILLVALMGGLVVSTADAGNRAGAYTVTVGSAYDFLAQKRNLHDTWLLPTLQLGYDIDQNWAIEGGYGTFKTNYKGPYGHNNVTGDLYTLASIYRLTSLNQSSPVEPFVSAGVGVSHINPNGANAQNLGNINAGLGAQMFFGEQVALRTEVRDVYTWAGSKNDVSVGLGVSFLFGGNSYEAPKAESGYKPEFIKTDYKGENVKA